MTTKKWVTILVIWIIIGVTYSIIRGDSLNPEVEVPGVITSEDQMYETIVFYLKNYKSKVVLHTNFQVNGLDAGRIVGEVRESNPIAAGLSGRYSWSWRVSRENRSQMTVKFNCPDASPRKAKKLEKRVKEIANVARTLPDDYSKIKAVHDYLILSNVYMRENYGAYNALYHGYSSCTGYALGFYLIMDELGIPVTYETGGNHAWNTVCLDGKWYNMDVTWDDAGDYARYDYFLKNNEDFKGHTYCGATAETSMDVHGPSDKEYFRMFPNYKLRRILFPIGVIIVCIIIIKIRDRNKWHIRVKKRRYE